VSHTSRKPGHPPPSPIPSIIEGRGHETTQLVKCYVAVTLNSLKSFSLSLIYTTMSVSSFSKWLLSKLSSMNTPSWYSFIFGCIVMTWLFSYGIRRVLNSRWPLTKSFILRHLVYPHVFPRVPFVGTATRFEFLIVFLYLLANTLILIIGVKAEIGSRAATLAIINFIPLLCGPRLSLLTRLLGISLRTSIGSHQWFGRTAVVQALVHAIAMVRGDAFTWSTVNLTGVVARSISLLIRGSLTYAIGKLYSWTHLSPLDPPCEAGAIRMVSQLTSAPNRHSFDSPLAPPIFEKVGGVVLTNWHMLVGGNNHRQLGLVRL
jgi:hypothetical protein